MQTDRYSDKKKSLASQVRFISLDVLLLRLDTLFLQLQLPASGGRSGNAPARASIDIHCLSENSRD